MMELNEWKEIWNRAPEGAEVATPLRGEELSMWIRERQESVRKRVQRRLRWEMWNYLGPALIVVTAVFVKSGGRGGMIGMAVVVALLGVLIATLVRKERQMSRAPMQGSVRESVGGLLEMLDSTARAYMAAYMVVMVAGLGALAVVAFVKIGVGVFSVAVLAACAAGVAWAYRSGQGYVRRMFGKYRAELRECLREVEG